MYHSFLIHSSVDGHLGYFHVLAIVNSAAMNTGYICLFQLWFTQGICPVVGLLGHTEVLFPVFFSEISKLFSMIVASIYIPTNNARRWPFLHILSIIYCLLIFLMMTILTGGRWYKSHFWFASLIISDVEYFSHVYWPSLCLIWRNVCLGFLPIFKMRWVVLWYWDAYVVIYFGD